MGFEGCLLDLCHLYPLLFVVQTAALLEDRHDEDPLAPLFKMYSRSKSNLTSGRCKTAMTGCYKGGGALLVTTGVITPIFSMVL